VASAFDNPAILRGLADKFPFGFYVVDPERTILYWNESAERITGYHAQEVVGRCCADDLLVHCGRQGTALCATGGCPFTFTLRDGGTSLFAAQRRPTHSRKNSCSADA
jgi:PAS domain-containing protein